MGACVLGVPGAEAVAHAGEPSAPAGQVPGLQIRSAQLDRTGLTIEFTESLHPVQDVDPSRFRLTFAYSSKKGAGTYSYYEQYYTRTETPLTVYSDLGAGALKSKLEQPRPNRIRIPAGPGLKLSALCRELSTAPRSQSQVGVYLHYAGGGKAQVESERGAALGAVAPYWLTKGPDTVTAGEFPNRPIPVSLVCR